MSLFNFLLISSLSLSIWQENETYYWASGRCDSLKFEHKIEASQNGKFNLTIDPKGGVGVYKLYLWDADGELLSEDNKKREFKNLSAGRYGGLLADDNRCSKKIEITIP